MVGITGATEVLEALDSTTSDGITGDMVDMVGAGTVGTDGIDLAGEAGTTGVMEASDGAVASDGAMLGVLLTDMGMPIRDIMAIEAMLTIQEDAFILIEMDLEAILE